MRTIKFRGKVILGNASNHWKEGDLIQYHMQEDQLIYNANIRSSCGIVYAINPKTLGQFTGLYDKNGNEIYENDLLKCIGSKYFLRVYFKNAQFLIEEVGGVFSDLTLNEYIQKNSEVIGNIHDNPELL